MVVYLTGALVIYYAGRFIVRQDDFDSGLLIVAVAAWPVAWWLVPICILLFYVGSFALLGLRRLFDWLDLRVAFALSRELSRDEYGAIFIGPRLPNESDRFAYVKFYDPSIRRYRKRRISERNARRWSPKAAIASFWSLPVQDYHPNVES